MKKQFTLTGIFLFLLIPFSFGQIDSNILSHFQQEEATSKVAEELGLQLIDDIGPRLMGSPNKQKANDWLVSIYRKWGIDAENQQYGTWKGWERGITEAVLTHPRFQQLNATQLAWSPQTPKGGYVETEVVALPLGKDAKGFSDWLPTVKGKIVLISKPYASGRPLDNWKEFALPEDLTEYQQTLSREDSVWEHGFGAFQVDSRTLQRKLEEAGAIAVISNNWSKGWGADRIYGTMTRKIPNIDLKLEDYMLLYRFISRGIIPKIRLKTTSKNLGKVPAVNTVAAIKGKLHPEEYVFLSAHLDSWDPATGATDNGTGTILMMETMRILKKYYPNPKRSIMVGHWGGEEEGLNGSRAFVADHQDILSKISVLFNQDNGTGRISAINGNGFIDAYDYFSRWMTYLPEDNRNAIKTTFPGAPGGRGNSDYFPFLTYGVPAFFLLSNSWDYGTYTWHNNYDTYDKIVWSEIHRNAVTLATLVYLACEEPEMFSRRKAEMPVDIHTGERRQWPAPQQPDRDGEQYFGDD